MADHSPDSRQVNTWVPIEDAQGLDDLAAAETRRTKYKVTKADIVRRLIQEAVAAHKGKTKPGDDSHG